MGGWALAALWTRGGATGTIRFLADDPPLRPIHGGGRACLRPPHWAGADETTGPLADGPRPTTYTAAG